MGGEGKEGGGERSVDEIGKRKPATNQSSELCESGGGRPGLPVPNSPYGLCGRKATLNLN